MLSKSSVDSILTETGACDCLYKHKGRNGSIPDVYLC